MKTQLRGWTGELFHEPREVLLVPGALVILSFLPVMVLVALDVRPSEATITTMAQLMHSLAVYGTPVAVVGGIGYVLAGRLGIGT